MEEDAKRDKAGIKFIIYGAIILVCIFLIIFFISKIKVDNDSHYSYHGFDFIKANGMVQTQIQLKADRSKLYTIELRYGPRDLEDIPIIGEPKQFNLVDEMYIAFDPMDENLSTVGIATADIQMNLIRVLGKTMHAACTQESEECGDAPVKNCENTKAPIIIVRHDPIALVEQKGNCLFVQGPGMDVVKSADKFLLYLYGIMD